MLLQKSVILFFALLVFAYGNYTLASTTASFSHTLNVELFSSNYDLRKDSPFNPNNDLGRLPDSELTFMARSGISADINNVNLSLNPRISQSRINLEGAITNETEAFLQEWNLSYSPGSWSASYTREIVFWGPSLFSSPSNPYYDSNNRTNPFVELDAREFVRIDRFSGNLSMSMIVNVNEGRDRTNSGQFAKTYSVKIDYTGYEFHGGAILSEHDSTIKLGLYGQWTANDALMLYTDIGFKDRSRAYYPVVRDAGIGFDFEIREQSTHATDALIGFSYATAGGSTWGMEYRHNTEGYGQDHSDNYYNLVDLAASSFVNQDENVFDATRLLSIASDPGIRTIHRNYLYAQYFKRDVISELSLNGLMAYNLDTKSSQITLVANYYLNEHIAVAANFVINSGSSRENEYKRYIKNVYFAGIKYYF